MATLARLCVFAREHQDQARIHGDELRAEQWNDIIDQLLERTVNQIVTA
jgi:hypothetical protein